MKMNSLKTFLKYYNGCMGHPPIGKSQKLLNCLNIQYRHCSKAFNEKFLLNEDDNFYSKIIYNDVLRNVRNVAPKSTASTPIFFKYLNKEDSKVQDEKIETEPEIVNFPFKVREEVLPDLDLNANVDENNKESSDKAEFEVGQWKMTKYKIDVDNLECPSRWNIMSLVDDKIDNAVKFGTCDPNEPISRIPCGGCGAFFHCNDPSIPGFMPKEIFKAYTKEELRGKICQRCHFLKRFNVALGVNVIPSQYEKIISTINDKEGLVIFMVDLLDFPCSIYPEIFNLIGPTKPVVVVGNKIDLLMQEDESFMDNFKNSLLSSLKQRKLNIENIKHVALISAKTGYGVEDLISTIQSCWGDNGDIYLIGCTNVGKSSLFNTLIQSDLCKINAVDILQRATVSAWPGTTLNLLKFPIAKPSPWRLAARQNRLTKEEHNKLAFRRLQFSGQLIRFQQIPLADTVGITFKHLLDSQKSDETDQSEEKNDKKRKGINPRVPEFAFSKWVYDTPGVVHHDQILSLLTTSELLLTLPTKILVPRNFRMLPGYSLFIGGLARLDYISGPQFVWFTVFASEGLPVTVTKIEDAPLVYQKLLGSPLFRVPQEGKSRLSKWPNLASKKFEIFKKTKSLRVNSKDNNSLTEALNEADADVVLSSAGWVSVQVTPPYRCFVEAWTPEGRGIHVRDVPIIKKGHTYRGKKIGKTIAYESVVKQVDINVMDKPPF